MIENKSDLTRLHEEVREREKILDGTCIHEGSFGPAHKYRMKRSGLLYRCGITGKTRIVIEYNNDTGEGWYRVVSEDPNRVTSKTEPPERLNLLAADETIENEKPDYSINLRDPKAAECSIHFLRELFTTLSDTLLNSPGAVAVIGSDHSEGLSVKIYPRDQTDLQCGDCNNQEY